MFELDNDNHWEILREENKFSRCDCWLRHKEKNVWLPVELKSRDLDLNTIYNEGVIIDYSKVEALMEFGMAIIVQLFPINNVALIWKIKRGDNMDVKERMCRKNNVCDEKVMKEVVYLQVADAKKFNLDMHSFYQIMAFASVLGETE